MLDARPHTRAIRSGVRRTPEGEKAEPIFSSSTFLFDSPENAAAKFAGEVDGNVYSRYTMLTVRAFGERLAALEQGWSAVATASGLSAILALRLTRLKAEDHVPCSRDVFGATAGVSRNTPQKCGVAVSFVPLTGSDQWREASKPNT